MCALASEQGIEKSETEHDLFSIPLQQLYEAVAIVVQGLDSPESNQLLPEAVERFRTF